MRKSREPPASRFPTVTDKLAIYLDGCPRCGGVGCKECERRRAILEHFGYEPDDLPVAHEPGAFDLEADGDGPTPRFEDDEDIVNDDRPRRRRKETEDESFARRLAMGVSMLAEADDSILDE